MDLLSVKPIGVACAVQSTHQPGSLVPFVSSALQVGLLHASMLSSTASKKQCNTEVASSPDFNVFFFICLFLF